MLSDCFDCAIVKSRAEKDTENTAFNENYYHYIL